MILIFINELGKDYKGQKQYEFLFSESAELENDDWYTIPASSAINPLSPDIEYIDVVGLLKDSDLDLELVQNSDYFGMIDAIDGVISLGWEKFSHDSEFDRLCFNFGETIESVSKKLKQRNYFLNNQDIKLNDI